MFQLVGREDMDLSNFYALIGFLLAAYAVVGNDSVQTLGTFISSNTKAFKWYWLWLGASLVLIATISYSWVAYDGDISYGRLEKIPPIEIQWYHAAAPALLVMLTRFGIPVSTTFLVLSVFVTSDIMKDVLIKSAVGYGVAAIVAFVLWLGISRLINERYDKVRKERRAFWRTLQWCSTGFLWFSWLSHDMANIAVFAPRQMPFWMLIGVLFVLCGWLALIFKTAGGKIQKVVLEKTGTRFMRSATIIDFVYALILIYFKEMNSLPMSTTWVFVGLLAGRQFAISLSYHDYTIKDVFPLVGKDFLKMMIGVCASVLLVLGVQYLLGS